MVRDSLAGATSTAFRSRKCPSSSANIRSRWSPVTSWTSIVVIVWILSQLTRATASGQVAFEHSRRGEGGDPAVELLRLGGLGVQAVDRVYRGPPGRALVRRHVLPPQPLTVAGPIPAT